MDYERYSLGTRFYDLFGVRLSHAALLIPIIAAAGLLIPLLVRPSGQRLTRPIEILCFLGVAVFLTFGWALWAIDYCDRMAEDRATPVMFGIIAAISIVVIFASAIPRWRKGECLTGYSLIPTIAMIVIQIAFFMFFCFVVTFVVLSIVISIDAPLAALYLPDWIGLIILAISDGSGDCLYLVPTTHLPCERPAQKAQGTIKKPKPPILWEIHYWDIYHAGAGTPQITPHRTARVQR
jgi:hypothetical protein